MIIAVAASVPEVRRMLAARTARRGRTMIVFAFLTQTLRIAIPYLFAASGGVDLGALRADRARARGIHARRRVLRRAGELLQRQSVDRARSARWPAAWRSRCCMRSTAIRFRADQVVVGIAVNLLVIGATRFFLRLAFHSSANSPRVPGFGAEQSGTGIASLVANPLVWLGSSPSSSWRGCCIERRLDCACGRWANIRRRRCRW